MLKTLTGEGILLLTRVCQVARKFGKASRDWQTGVIILIFKKGDRKQCTNYREILFVSLPGKVYAKCLETKCREIVESKLEDGQSGFRPGRSSTDQIFTLKQIFKKPWEYGKEKVLQEYGVNGQLFRAIKSFYCRPEVCVRVNGKQSKLFIVGVDLRQGCILSPLFLIVCKNWSTNAAKLMSVPRLEIPKSVVCYSLMIWFCFLPQNLASSAE